VQRARSTFASRAREHGDVLALHRTSASGRLQCPLTLNHSRHCELWHAPARPRGMPKGGSGGEPRPAPEANWSNTGQERGPVRRPLLTSAKAKLHRRSGTDRKLLAILLTCCGTGFGRLHLAVAAECRRKGLPHGNCWADSWPWPSLSGDTRPTAPAAYPGIAPIRKREVASND
jgi:hypothetical protein